MDIYTKIDELYDKRRLVELGGGDERIQKQYDRGKLTARDRINYLLDEDTFVELNPFMESDLKISEWIKFLAMEKES